MKIECQVNVHNILPPSLSLISMISTPSTMRQNILSPHFTSLVLFVIGVTVFTNLNSDILIDEKLVIDNKKEVPLSIEKNESSSNNTTISLIVSECNGSPQERRSLVEKESSATEQDWLHMIECVEERTKKMVGFFALHVSKSGGK